jgi:hypothetical protein
MSGGNVLLLLHERPFGLLPERGTRHAEHEDGGNEK